MLRILFRKTRVIVAAVTVVHCIHRLWGRLLLLLFVTGSPLLEVIVLIVVRKGHFGFCPIAARKSLARELLLLVMLSQIMMQLSSCAKPLCS